MTLPSTASGFSHAKPASPARLRAQRANAQLSTGPRTREGKRRSALNRLGLKRGPWVEWGDREPPGHREFLQVRRDLRVVFHFIRPELLHAAPRLELCLERAIREWGTKLTWAHKGFTSGSEDANIHSVLSDLLFELRLCNRKWRYWLLKEFGTDGRLDIGKLREGIEARMSSFRWRPGSGSHKRPLEKAEKRNFQKRGPNEQTQSPIIHKPLELSPDSAPTAQKFQRSEATPANDRGGTC